LAQTEDAKELDALKEKPAPPRAPSKDPRDKHARIGISTEARARPPPAAPATPST
jgi:hypothetical protein